MFYKFIKYLSSLRILRKFNFSRSQHINIHLATLSIKGLFETLSISDTQQNKIANMLDVIMLNVIMLHVVMLIVIMLIVAMLSFLKQSVVELSVHFLNCYSDCHYAECHYAD